MKSNFQSRFLPTAFLALWLVCLGFSTALGQVTLTPEEQAIANYMISNPDQQRPFLHMDPTLTQVARARAQDMANRGYFDHVDPQGYGPDWKVVQAGYPLPSTWINPVSLNYIESIAAGESSASQAWSDWMNSAPHKEHLLALDAGYVGETSYGIGYANVPGSQYQYYWVVITCPPASNVTITSPSAGSKVSDAQVAVTGTASGSSPVQTVQFRIENSAGVGAFQTASGTTNWSGTATGLIPGPNTLRVQSLGSGGTLLAQAASNFVYAVPTPLTVNVSGDGSVTSGFLGTTQRDEGVSCTITATPASGSLFAGWTGTVASTHPTLTFTMEEGAEETASFVPNPFPTRRGTYSAVLAGGEAGMIKVTLGGTGSFTAKVEIANVTYTTQGKLAADGTGTVTIHPHGQDPITLTFSLDVAGNSGLTGTVADNTGSTETFSAGQAVQASAGTFAQAGRYTVSLPPNPDNTDANVPMGVGYATLNVTKAGHATLTGSLADGTSFTGGAVATTSGTLAFYVPLYARKGGVSGEVTLRETSVSDLDGSFRWITPNRTSNKIAPAAFDTTVPVVGSTYTPPAPHTPVLDVTAEQSDNSALYLGDGNLTTPVVQPATLNNANQLSMTDPSLKGLKVTINATTGSYAGSFIHPITGERSRLHGIIFQKQNAGYGYFLGTSASGYVSLAPAAQ